ncbi:hypothetical protein [Kitasatospora sp. NPDC015120]|uniref:hypothetical protein n=1 Tax=Kitasatospora sp. NPDC015120 TaxID=3364023 RepID=UPI0036F4893F
MEEKDVTWNGAGRIVAALVGGEEYFFVAGSSGGTRARSSTPATGAPAPGREDSPPVDADPVTEPDETAR